MRNLITLLFLSVFHYVSFAQESQWDFYIALEDANGSKDTLKVFWSDEATSDYDIEFGEIPVSPQDSMNLVAYFDDMTWYPNAAPIQSIAGPWADEGTYGTFSVSNFTLPITLSWDVSKFFDEEQYPVLEENPIGAIMQNDFIFLDSEIDNLCQCLFMHEMDSYVLEVFPFEHFPIIIEFTKDRTINTNQLAQTKAHFSVGPNPIPQGTFSIYGADVHKIEKLELFSSSGKTINLNATSRISNRIEIVLEELPPGVYVLNIHTGSGIQRERLIIK